MLNSSSSDIHSQCDITDTQYNYNVSACVNYTFTVTPVNKVGDGTSASVTLLSNITEGEILNFDSDPAAT